MDRAEKIGLAVAGTGHLILFGLLSLGFLATPKPPLPRQPPVEVSLVKDVALEQAAPKPAVEAAQSVAPEEGLPEDAAPPAPEQPAPAPEPEPAPAPAPPKPAPPRPAPPKPAPPKPAPPKPAPKPAPVPKPAPAPKPKPRPVPAAEPAPAKAAPSAAAKPTRNAAAAKPTASKGSGTDAAATAQKPRGSRLGNDFLKGLSPEASKSRDPNPPASRIGAQAAANIGSAIQRQIQPCANRQVNPGPGAERIRVIVNLRINRDGSLAGRPAIRGHDGVDGENERYVARVDDLAVAAFVGCAPLTGLPADLYAVPGGWSNFTLRYKLPG